MNHLGLLYLILFLTLSLMNSQYYNFMIRAFNLVLSIIFSLLIYFEPYF